MSILLILSSFFNYFIEVWLIFNVLIYVVQQRDLIIYIHIYSFFILFFNLTIMYWFCHISKWICHRYTCVPHPEPSSLLPLHTIPLGRPSAPALSIQYSALNLDWQLVSYMILYMFQCHSPKSSHPLPLPQSPKDCSIHQCLFCCLIYRVIVTLSQSSSTIYFYACKFKWDRSNQWQFKLTK